MLAEGTSVYKDFYESTTHSIINRSKQKGLKPVTANGYRLKAMITHTEGVYIH